MSDKSVWATLSAIDCNDHVDKKGQFSYLSWTWAWAMVKEKYPESTYTIEPDIIYPDQTMEVRVTVTVHDPSGVARPFLAHTMWLPVLDFKNRAIANPNAFDINSARMRCLVKCLAIFGLGHYIYAGESAPEEPPVTFTADQRTRFIDLMANNDGWGLKKFGQEVGNDVMSALFSSFNKGEVSKNKAKVRELVGEANTALRASLEYIGDEISNNAPDTIQEHLAELTPLQTEFVINGLTEIQLQQLSQMGVSL